MNCRSCSLFSFAPTATISTLTSFGPSLCLPGCLPHHAPISAIGTIAVSYLIYELTSTERRADDDFKIIIGIYYKIEESFELLKKQNLKNDLFDDHNSFYERQIKVDCMLLLNYIRRYPHKKYDIKKLEDVIMAINVNPNYESDYIKLAEEFQNFCFALNPDRNTSSFTLDKNEKN